MRIVHKGCGGTVHFSSEMVAAETIPKGARIGERFHTMNIATCTRCGEMDRRPHYDAGWTVDFPGEATEPPQEGQGTEEDAVIIVRRSTRREGTSHEPHDDEPVDRPAQGPDAS